MKPIQIKTQGTTQKSSQEICATFLDTDRWSDFKGYSILPGIKSAHFEKRTPDLLGSRIKVSNTDGTTHVEEIIAWDVSNKFALKFQEFEPPLKNLATHFVEEWRFSTSSRGTEITRSMTMYPRGVLGWLMLLPISRLMKKAFEKNAVEMG
jgi:hypothetical protein